MAQAPKTPSAALAVPAPAPAPVEAEVAKALKADKDGNVDVATTGDFMLLDPLSGAEIEASGSTKVKLTVFIEQRFELGQLKAA